MSEGPKRYESWFRYQKILSALRQREHTAKTLAEDLQIPESTLRRDLLWMERNAPGVSAREDRKKKYFRSEALPELMYSGALCLLMGADAVSTVSGSDAWGGLKPLLQYAEAKLGRDAARKVCSLQGDFQLRDMQQEIFDVLIEAISESLIVELYYRSPQSEGVTKVEVQPLSLVRWRDRMYLVLQSSDRAHTVGVRRLDRIEDVQFTEPRRAFKYPTAEVYDPQRLFRQSLGPFVHEHPPQEPVILRFRGEEVQRHREYAWPVPFVVRRESPLEVELWCHMDESLMHFVMRLGAGVEVVSPQPLRAEIRRRLQDALGMYQEAEQERADVD
jgi:predicted DNA-binding transcriptional regulator YafY